MKRIWPALPLIVMGCSSGYGLNAAQDVAGTPNPRQLDNVYKVERIVQMKVPQVDVLWVLDSSGSMRDDLQAVMEHFPIFFNFFDGSGTDYHLGVISTDMRADHRRGKLISAHGHRYIDPETPNAEQVFRDMLPFLTVDTESGIATTYWALEHERHSHNFGFIRAESNLHIIVISDEHDHSDEQPVPGVQDFATYLEDFGQDRDELTFSTIGLPDSDYRRVTDMVGGIYRNINGSSWIEVIEELGLQAAVPQGEYYLSALPVPESIVVTVDEHGRTLAFNDSDWEYDPVRNSIRFHEFEPKPFSEVIIEYMVLAEYALRLAPPPR